MQTCQVFPGLILEDTIGPWCGFYPDEGRYVAVGSADVGVTFTAFGDIARAVIKAASLGKSAPKQLHLGGDTKSMNEIAAIMRRVGGRDIEVAVEELEKYKAATLASGGDLAGK